MAIFEFIINMFITAIIISLIIFSVAFVLWMAIDAGKQDKFWWLVFIIGIPIIGAVIYYFVEKRGDYIKIPKANKPE